MLPVGGEARRVSAWLSSCRLMAKLGQPHTPMRPRRLRIPHIKKVEIVGCDPTGDYESELGILLHLLRHWRIKQIGKIDLSSSEHRQRCRLRYALVHEPFHSR